MAQVKIGEFKFGEDTFTLRYVLEQGNQQVKFVAKDIANKLNFKNTKKAIRDHVDDKYKTTYSESGELLVPPTSDNVVKQGDPLYLQPHTVLITKEGVIQLIMKSKLPYALELQAWLLEEVIPQVLCTGKYAPAVKMDTNYGVIEELNKKLAFASESLAEANEKIIHFANALVTANAGLVQANTMLNEARRETAQLANRMADIAQDVIAKPNNPQLLHSLAVCALGGEKYAFLRAQKRSLNRSIKRLGSSDVVFSSDYVPNAMNVLNKVKETLPRNQYKAKHNKITLLQNLTREQLIDAVQSSMTERQIARLNNNFNL
nr:baculovirus repeat orf a [Bombyx mori nucleopolyhedrovirus]WRK23417.1 baculovirus repeat orf a [Bombyx mori nucleopolyhedrovirus]WRK23555.1 baculovirus repeat orf a [Bombyx mori nucleopolyhedrovirus]WRK23969.1 baculovirus repeat orf a [Bombyx mori nucleopolyhedrovirus]